MEVDLKTLVIAVLGVALLFMLFQTASTTSESSTGAVSYKSNYGSAPAGSAPVNYRSVNDLPSRVGGC